MALWCRLFKSSCPLMQRRLVTKLAADQVAKKERKSKKMETRKEM